LNPFLEKIYFISPIALQDFLVSLYGYKLYLERYVGNHARSLSKLLETQWVKKVAVDKQANKDFLRIFQHAFRNVPYYRGLCEKGIVSLDAINSIEDIAQLPVLSKEQVRENADALLADGYDGKKVVSINTSGTTGKTLKIFVDHDSRRYGYAFFSRLKRWAGIDCKRPNVTFAGRTFIHPETDRPPFWRRNLKMNNWLFSSYHLSPGNLASYVDKLQDISPHFIDSYPSSIYTLASYMLKNNVTVVRPKAIITSSETLLDYQRQVIETAFHCPVFDQYGCAEQVVFISQCEHGSYHIHPEFGYVEFLRQDGSQADPGEEARLICTGFTNRAMPLIRYDIGDTAVFAKEQSCACGRNFPVVEKIIGRTDDILVLRDGRRVGRLDPVFKGLVSIKEAQIVQTDLDTIVLKIVPGANYNRQEADVVVGELKKRLGNQVAIEVQVVQEIPRTSSGKFRAVITMVRKNL